MCSVEERAEYVRKFVVLWTKAEIRPDACGSVDEKPTDVRNLVVLLTSSPKTVDHLQPNVRNIVVLLRLRLNTTGDH